MSSFKLRLVAYFVALSLVPLAGATWAFSETAAKNELARADEGLARALRSAAGQVTTLLDAAEAEAASLARSRDVQRALIDADPLGLAAAARLSPGASFLAGDGRLLAGPAPGDGLTRSAVVLADGEPVGRVLVSLPLDDALVARLSSRAGLGREEVLLAAEGGRVAAGLGFLLGEPVPGAEGPLDLELRGERYRALSAPLPSSGATLLAAVPRSAVDTAVTGLHVRLLLAAAGAIAIVAAVAFLPAHSIAASLRDLALAAAAIAQGRFSERVAVRGRDEVARVGVAFNQMAEELERRRLALESERGRVRAAHARVGAALAAGSEQDALFRIVAESTLEATGAVGAIVAENDEERVRLGETTGGEPLRIGVRAGDAAASVTVSLFPPAEGFGEEALDAAAALAASASAAIENARLHELLHEQAVTDALTGLANRRRLDETLANEVSRARRFGAPLGLVVADLDHFKRMNDRFGHQFGDRVLRLVAQVILDTVRGIDLAARQGGEEFAVVLPGTDLAGALVVAERLRERIAASELLAPDGTPVRPTASFGAATWQEPLDAARLAAAADEALYHAKAEGRDRVVAARLEAVGADRPFE